MSVSNQIENFRGAIQKKKARIIEINLVLAQLPLRGVTAVSRRQLIEERLHLEEALEELEREIQRYQLEQADRQFQWEDIDQRLLSPKNNDLADEMGRRVSEGMRRVEFETAQSGNSAGFASRLLDFRERLTQERVQRLYDAYCETWTQQNRMITPSFIRAFRDRVVAHTLAGVNSSVVESFSLRAQRTGHPVNSGAIRSWSRRIHRLANRWNRKLEAEAVALQYRALNSSAVRSYPAGTSGQSTQDLVPGPPSSIWHRLHDTFRALSEEESRSDPPNPDNRYLRAFGSYQNAPEGGLWHLEGGANEGIRERFAVAASRAGMVLCPSVGKRFEAWLNHLFLELVKGNSNLLFVGELGKDGMILRVCEASAVSCARLERSALESEANSPTRKPLIGYIDSNITKSGRKPIRSHDFVICAGQLWLEAKQKTGSSKITNQQLAEIASVLDGHNLLPPANFLEGNCAADLRAFNSKNSRSKIGAIQTWSRLVVVGDKDHLRGMRKLLSRCSHKVSG